MWLVAGEVWVSFSSFQVSIGRVENRTSLQLCYAFIYKVCIVLFARESPSSVPEIRFRGCFPKARCSFPCVVDWRVSCMCNQSFLQSKSRVEATIAPISSNGYIDRCEKWWKIATCNKTFKKRPAEITFSFQNTVCATNLCGNSEGHNWWGEDVGSSCLTSHWHYECSSIILSPKAHY